jgi:hypothetical protein
MPRLADFFVFEPQVLYQDLPDLALLPAGLIYSGLHLLAWNVPLPSLRDVWLWKISAILVVGCLPLDFLTRLMLTSMGQTNGRWGKVGSLMFWSWTYLWLFGQAANFLVYIVARFTLIILSFKAFAYSPGTVFYQPSWLRYFPHLN